MAHATETSDLAFLLQFGQPEDVRHLIDRTPDALRAVLSTSERLPLPLVDAVLTTDGPALGWSAGNKTLTGQVTFLRAQGTTLDRAYEAIDQLTREMDCELPWAALLAAHRHEPLPDPLLVVLAGRDGCPGELTSASRPAAVRIGHPTYSARRRGPRPDATDLLRQYPLDRGEARWVATALEHGLMTPLDILRHAHPAHHAAAILAEAGPHGGWPAAYREALRLAATHLGDDPEAWAVAVRLLPDFAGTIPELLATAAAVVS